jgi:tRNA/rRNA methyltransferase
VLLVAYEYFQTAAGAPEKQLIQNDTRPATLEERHLFFDRLEKTLEETNFFRTEAMREIQWRKVQNLFTRADLTDQELRILHGMLSAFEGRRLR